MNDFSVGSVLSDTFRVMFGNFPRFALITLVLTSPILLFWGDPIGSAVLSFLLPSLASAFVIFGAIRTLRGAPWTVGEALPHTLRVILPVLGLSILLAIAVSIGFLLLIVPGVILSMMWFVAVPARVAEPISIFGAFSRSQELTSGYRWRILGLWCVVIGVTILVSFIVGFVTALLAGGGAAAGADGGFIQFALINWVFSALTILFWAVMSSVTYYRLRVAHEGGDSSDVAKVFS